MSEEMKLKGLTAYAEMMNTLDTDCLEPFLGSDLRYNSQWVLEEMVGKKRYLEYMQGKFELIKESGSRPFAEIGELNEYPSGPCVVIAQGERGNLIATVLVKVDNDTGLVTTLDMCAVPDPKYAKRTGEYPGMQ